MSFVKFYDGNRLRKTYPFTRLRPIQTDIAGTGGGTSNVEVAIINFNNTDSGFYNFTSTYTSIPVCVISPEDENVNVFITELTLTKITVGSSDDFTGKVHVHIYPDSVS